MAAASNPLNADRASIKKAPDGKSRAAYRRIYGVPLPGDRIPKAGNPYLRTAPARLPKHLRSRLTVARGRSTDSHSS